MSKGRTYKVDGEKCTWRELIKKAEDLDDNYASQQLKYTSRAAEILRQYGMKVEECTG